MNRFMSSRMVLCRAASISLRSRPITSVTQTTIKQTKVTSDSPAVEGVTETFVTSELNKVGVVTQKVVIDSDGNMKKQTIPPQKWDADLASASEEIVKAERSKDGKSDISVEKMQKKSLKELEQKDQKLSNAKKHDNE